MTRVLVVDDDDMVRETFVVALERGGFEVADAANGREAQRRLEQSTFDVVVTDILMPEKDGIEMILDIRKRDPGLGIVAVSGGGAMDAIKLLDFARELGADRVVPKPVQPATLVDLVREVAAERARQ